MSAPPCTAEARPRSTGQVYGCLGCSAQCGRCARTIRKIMDEALDAAATACNGCPRHAEALNFSDFGLKSRGGCRRFAVG